MEQAHKEEWAFGADHPEVFAATDNSSTPIEYLIVGLASCLTAGVASLPRHTRRQRSSDSSKPAGPAPMIATEVLRLPTTPYR